MTKLTPPTLLLIFCFAIHHELNNNLTRGDLHINNGN